MAEIIAIANQKGGVGKTTTSINLASSLSKNGFKVLLIDFDPQGNCTNGVGIDPCTVKYIINDLILNNKNIDSVIMATCVNNLHIMPTNVNLAVLEPSILHEGIDPNFILKEVIIQNQLNTKYDFIIIDCPPSLAFLSINALNAATSVLIPVQCEVFAYDAITQVLTSISSIQKSSNPELDILGFLMTMYDTRTTLSNEISSMVARTFKEKTFKTQIPRNIYIPESCAEGKPINIYKPNASGAIAYNQLAKEVINYVRDKKQQSI